MIKVVFQVLKTCPTSRPSNNFVHLEEDTKMEMESTRGNDLY